MKVRERFFIRGSPASHGCVAHFIADQFAGAGFEADVENAAHVTHGVDPGAYDTVVVTASLHYGKFQRPVRRWVARHALTLLGRPALFVPVCLSVRERTEEAERELLLAIMTFEQLTSWRPESVKIVAGAIAYTHYGFFKRYMMRRLARKKGDPTDTSRDHVFTDWNDLAAFVHEFAERQQTARQPVGV